MDSRQTAITRLAALEEPVRRDLFDYVSRKGEPVGRDEAGDAVGISRTLAAYHLDRMVETGLLKVGYARTSGRSGPGAGRPAKLYEPADEETAVSVPPRDYEFVADLLAEAAEQGRTVDEVAHERGREVGAGSSARPGKAALNRVLRERGYEPFADKGTTRLRNCPFHRVAVNHRDLVCGMNLSFTQGLLEGLGRDDLDTRLDPGPDRCCVAICKRGS